MNWLMQVFSRRRIYGDLSEEIREHLEEKVEELVARGISRKEASHVARREFGNVELVKESAHDVWGWRWLEDLMEDLRFGLRMLRKNPGFTVVAILTLAVGIGANSAILSVVSAVLLRPLPFPNPEKIVQLGAGLDNGEPNGSVTVPQFIFCRDHCEAVFDSVAGFQGGPALELKQHGRVDWVTSLQVTDDFFRVVGASPALGRGFRREETQPGALPSVVLSDALWRRTFDANPDVIGAQLYLDDGAYTIVGVTPRDFTFVEQPTDVYIPQHLGNSLGDQGTNTRMIARLKPGVSITQAQAHLNIVFEQFPEKDSRLFVGDYHRWLAGDSRSSLIVLFGAVGLLLLIACVNVASLMLGRVSSRQREMSIRLAMGARPGRLLRQLLTESFLVALIGVAVGLLAAYWALGALVSAIPFNLRSAGSIRLDGSVLLFTFGIALVTTVAFGLASFWQTTRGNLNATLKEGGSQTRTGATHSRLRNLLVTCEIALSLALLVGAALFGESLYRLHQEKLGFDPQNLVTMTTPINQARNPTVEQVGSFEQQLLARIQSLPSVDSAAIVTVAPLTSQANLPAQLLGNNDAQHSFGGTEVRAVSTGYFTTMRIPVLRGRGILENDTAGTSPVVVINEALARRWWNSGNPIGERIVIGSFQGHNLLNNLEPPREVVGVVADVKGKVLVRPAPPMVYIPAAQNRVMLGGTTDWVVRTSSSTDIASALRQAVVDVNPEQRITAIHSMTDVVAGSVAGQSFDALLVGLFAGIALALASVGMYGVLNLYVSQRTHEMGVRIAMGAHPRQVLKLVVAQGLGLALAGVLIGTATALGLSRFLTTLLYQVKPTNYAPYLVGAIFTLAVAALASYIPARRAMRVDPIVALRYE
jgi:putative ABC transport system permease protein